MRGRWLLGGLVVLAVLGWRWAGVDSAGDAAGVLRAPAVVSPKAGASPQLAHASGSTAPVPAASDAAQHVAMVLQQGSLAGTEPDGDWGRWSGEVLLPSVSLRRRFDYLLTTLGEAQPAQLREWISAQVSAQHGAAGKTQVLAVWDRYLALLQTAPVEHVDTADDASLRRAMAELTAQRNAALGPAWAYAFFADDGAENEAFLARRSAGRAAPSSSNDAAPSRTAPEGADAMALLAPPVTPLSPDAGRRRDAERVATFGAEAAARLRSEEADWATWQAQLSLARARREAIAADPQLSALQRVQAQEAELTRAFSGGELLRARALLGAYPP